VIKINLAARRQKELAPPSGMSLGGILEKVDLSVIQDLPIKKVLGPVIIGLIAGYILDSYKESEVGKIQKEIEKAEKDAARYQVEISKFKNYEGLKKSLDEDEGMIKSKLDTIQKLMENRGDPVKMLSLLSSTIPRNVWLTSYKKKQTDVMVSGATTDFNQISDFMKNLIDSSRFTDVELSESKQQDVKAGQRVSSSFDLKAVWK